MVATSSGAVPDSSPAQPCELPRRRAESQRSCAIRLRGALPGVERARSDLEDFVQSAIVRFDLPPPVAAAPGRVQRAAGVASTIAYPAVRRARGQGFPPVQERTIFDRDGGARNELQLAGIASTFTSASRDWEIAGQIAEVPGAAARRAHRAPFDDVSARRRRRRHGRACAVLLRFASERAYCWVDFPAPDARR